MTTSSDETILFVPDKACEDADSWLLQSTWVFGQSRGFRKDFQAISKKNPQQKHQLCTNIGYVQAYENEPYVLCTLEIRCSS